jgi:hypothetical protein
LGSASDLAQSATKANSDSLAQVAKPPFGAPNFPFFSPPVGIADRSKKEQQQNIARQLDNSRLNNATSPILGSPPFAGGQSAGVAYLVIVRIQYSLNAVRYTAGFNTWATTDPSFYLGSGQFRAIAGPISSVTFSKPQPLLLDIFINGAFFNQVAFVAEGMSNALPESATIFSVTRVDGQSDTGGSPPAPVLNPNPNLKPPVQPFPLDTWLYGSPEIQVTGNALALSKKLWEGNGLKPSKEPEKQSTLPIAIAPSTPPSQERKAVEPPRSPDTGLKRTPSGLPIVANPTEKKPKDLGLIPSMSKPPFSARPFVSGVSDPSEAYEPRDSKTGLTRTELEQQWVNQQNQIQENGKAGERAAALNDAKNIKQQLDNLSDTPNAALGGKSPKQQQTEAYLNSIKGNEIRESAFKQVANNTSPLNSTPTTPSGSPNTVQILGGIAGVAATVTALKIGSDLLVNNSLSNTPKIDQIAQNTTNTNQQTNAKQGICDAFQPQQCAFEGSKQASIEATQPIKDVANANNGLLQGLLAALQAIQAFLTSNIGKIIDLLNNSVVDRTLAVMNLVTNIHNAAMLTRDIGVWWITSSV